MYTAKGQLNRDAMFHQHMPLVRRVPTMIAKLPQRGLDDLIQVGLIGLDRRAYATRSRRAQFEDLRQPAHPRRHARRAARRRWMIAARARARRDIEQAMHRVEQRLGRSP